MFRFLTVAYEDAASVPCSERTRPDSAHSPPLLRACRLAIQMAATRDPALPNALEVLLTVAYTRAASTSTNYEALTDAPGAATLRAAGFLRAFGLAPCFRRYVTISACPSSAESMSGVMPFSSR